MTMMGTVWLWEAEGTWCWQTLRVQGVGPRFPDRVHYPGAQGWGAAACPELSSPFRVGHQVSLRTPHSSGAGGAQRPRVPPHPVCTELSLALEHLPRAEGGSPS